MSDQLGEEALDLPFRGAHSHKAWLDKPVSDDILRRVTT